MTVTEFQVCCLSQFVMAQTLKVRIQEYSISLLQEIVRAGCLQIIVKMLCPCDIIPSSAVALIMAIAQPS